MNYRINMNFTDFFNGNQVVGQAIGNLINENIDILWQDLAPTTFKAAEDIMKTIIDDSIGEYAAEDMFLS